MDYTYEYCRVTTGMKKLIISVHSVNDITLNENINLMKPIYLDKYTKL